MCRNCRIKSFLYWKWYSNYVIILTIANSVSRFKDIRLLKNSCLLKNGVAGAEPPTGTRGGSPTLSPGTDAGRVCPKALHDAEPTKHTQPFTEGKGFGVRDREFTLFFIKTDFFYKPRFYKSESHQQPLNLIY